MSAPPELMNPYDCLYQLIIQKDLANQNRQDVSKQVDLTPNITGVDPELTKRPDPGGSIRALNRKPAS